MHIKKYTEMHWNVINIFRNISRYNNLGEYFLELLWIRNIKVCVVFVLPEANKDF